VEGGMRNVKGRRKGMKERREKEMNDGPAIIKNHLIDLLLKF
jgi:hypothetical protein